MLPVLGSAPFVCCRYLGRRPVKELEPSRDNQSLSLQKLLAFDHQPGGQRRLTQVSSSVTTPSLRELTQSSSTPSSYQPDSPTLTWSREDRDDRGEIFTNVDVVCSLYGTVTSPTYSSTSRWFENKYLCSTWLEFNPEVPHQTTSSFEFFTLSLRPRENTVNIAAKASDSTICTMECRLPIFPRVRWYWSSSAQLPRQRARKGRALCCPYNDRWLSCHS